MNFKGKSLISIKDLTKVEILHILKTIGYFKKTKNPKLLENFVLGSCFFEPSTRTRLSTEAAMSSLGGKVVGFADPSATSQKKHETLHDSIKIISQYVDILAIRHPQEGSARLASQASKKPIINCGDGANQHPSQTLLDLFTIQETQKKLQGLNIAMVGDLKYGRTVHSLAEALSHFKARLYFVAPMSLQMPQHILNELKVQDVKFSLHDKMENVIKKVDILYMTRIQEERFPDKYEYEKVKNVYVLRPEMLVGAKKNMKIMHPLPRVSEIDFKIDKSPHAYYFEQAQNGLYTRQALISLFLGKIN